MCIIGILLYGVGIPVGLFLLLWKNRKHLNEMKFIKRYGSVYYCYSHKRWYWEVVVKLRYVAVRVCRAV